MNGAPDLLHMSSNKVLDVVYFFATPIDNLSNTATSTERQKSSLEKDSPVPDQGHEPVRK